MTNRSPINICSCHSTNTASQPRAEGEPAFPIGDSTSSGPAKTPRHLRPFVSKAWVVQASGGSVSGLHLHPHLAATHPSQPLLNITWRITYSSPQLILVLLIPS
ncbi:hypothetical protein E2C01_045958 [Portunus trituberculatus]|uniref:Uncharacterized protein n=1 Tax=Portunus trituberculatus TaxID=210409 RepID=A0A5B7G4H9_PORTR|nr:hypothetical protein [Portunus trituberculatus]